MTYEPARLDCVEGFAVAYMHRTSGNEQIVGTFRARRSLTTIMIASEGSIVYTGLVEDGDVLKQVEVPVTVHSHGKVASFRSRSAPTVLVKAKND